MQLPWAQSSPAYPHIPAQCRQLNGPFGSLAGGGRAMQTRREIDRLGQGTLGVSSAAAICLLGFHFFQYLYV